jgi:hypothetical protein
MQAIKLQTYVAEDGILSLQLPPSMAERHWEVLVVLQAIPSTEESQLDELGWPLGFFDRTYGSLADMPIDLGPDLPAPQRDELE